MKLQEITTKIDVMVEDYWERNYPIDYLKLQYVYDEYIRLQQKIERIILLMEERQFLIELHFVGPIFPLNAHEKYHDVSEEIRNDSVDFFKDAKIFLNDFTRFYISEIPHEERRGLTLKSFGSCIHAVCKNIGNYDGIIYKMLSVFENEGKWINLNVCSYRDDFIEHSKELTSPELSTTLFGVELLHMKGGSHRKRRTQLEEQKAIQRFLTNDDMTFVKTEYGTSCYVHIKSNVLTGTNIAPGYSIGEPFDSTMCHFKKYGVHVHYFPPGGAQGNWADVNKVKLLGQSPEVITSFEKISRFFLKSLSYLKEYKKNLSD